MNESLQGSLYGSPWQWNNCFSWYDLWMRSKGPYNHVVTTLGLPLEVALITGNALITDDFSCWSFQQKREESWGSLQCNWIWLQILKDSSTNLAHQANLTSMANTNTRSLLLVAPQCFVSVQFWQGQWECIRYIDRWVLNKFPNSPRMEKNTQLVRHNRQFQIKAVINFPFMFWNS